MATRAKGVRPIDSSHYRALHEAAKRRQTTSYTRAPEYGDAHHDRDVERHFHGDVKHSHAGGANYHYHD
jgi:hypothetical protein